MAIRQQTAKRTTLEEAATIARLMRELKELLSEQESYTLLAGYYGQALRTLENAHTHVCHQLKT